MIKDPLFIIGIAGMSVCLISWIRFSTSNQKTEPFFIKYLSTISFISAIALLLSIFYNSGDLGIVLLAGSVIAFIVMVLGYFLKNTEIVCTKDFLLFLSTKHLYFVIRIICTYSTSI